MGNMDYQHSQPLGTRGNTKKAKPFSEIKKLKKQVKCPECAGPHPASECDSEIPDQAVIKFDSSFYSQTRIIPSGTAILSNIPPSSNTQTWSDIKNQNKPDMINHPAHYTKGIEVLEYTESWDMGPNDYATTKYITRYRYKHAGNPEKQIEDLNKAIFYIKRQIGLIEKGKLKF